MPRKGPARSGQIVNDPVYGSPVVTQLINKVLLDGKRSKCRVARLRRTRRMPREDRHRPGPDPQASARQRSSQLSRCAPVASVAPPTRSRLR